MRTSLILVACHTKNKYDGTFGMVKRKLNKRQVLSPSVMMRVIGESSECNEGLF